MVRDFILLIYSNLKFYGDKDNGLATAYHAMSLGSIAISWRSQKKTISIDSTIEAKYVAAIGETKDTMWIRKTLEYL